MGSLVSVLTQIKIKGVKNASLLMSGVYKIMVIVSGVNDESYMQFW